MTKTPDHDEFLQAIQQRMRQRRLRPQPMQSKYIELLEAVIDVIEHGAILPGQKLPPEALWSNKLDVGLGTVQKALKYLSDTGIVQRKRAQGTFLSSEISPSSGVINYRFFDPKTGKDLNTDREILSIRRAGSDGSWREHFKDAETVMEVVLRMRVGQEPASFGRWFVVGNHLEDLLSRPKLIRSFESLHDLIAHYTKRPTAHVNYHFSCAQIPEEGCKAISIREGSLAVLWEFYEFGYDHRPTSFGQIYLPEGHRPLVVRDIKINRSN